MIQASSPRYVGTRILDILSAQGRRPAWVAAKMGIDYSYFFKVTRGQKPITERFVRDACRVLELPADVLFVAADQSVSATTESGSDGKAA